MFILIPLGVVILAGIVYLAISKKTSPVMRIAALCALGLMVITVIVCLFIIFGLGGEGRANQPVYSETPAPDIPPPGPPVMNLLIFVIFMVALFIVVLILSLRERNRSKKHPEVRNNGWD